MSIKKVIADTFRLLTFRITEQEMVGFTRGHLIFGLAFTWLVGMGRYWDDPRAGILQHLGVGSVVYVFVLAFILRLVVYPLRPKNWSYFSVLTFISLVSPPAILYAIPVEKFFSLDVSNSLNAMFLLIVATWRLALLLFFLLRFTGLTGIAPVVAALLPVTAIVFVLVVLNLERAAIDLMGGIRDRTPNDASYGVMVLILGFSIVIFPLNAISYILLIYLRSIKQGSDELSILPANDPE